jgi:hypothetical protein
MPRAPVARRIAQARVGAEPRQEAHRPEGAELRRAVQGRRGPSRGRSSEVVGVVRVGPELDEGAEAAAARGPDPGLAEGRLPVAGRLPVGKESEGAGRSGDPPSRRASALRPRPPIRARNDPGPWPNGGARASSSVWAGAGLAARAGRVEALQPRSSPRSGVGPPRSSRSAGTASWAGVPARRASITAPLPDSGGGNEMSPGETRSPGLHPGGSKAYSPRKSFGDWPVTLRKLR